MNRKQRLGKWGEETASAHLESQGYTITGRNMRTPYGEIDLIASHPGAGLLPQPVIVFVEVKTRASSSLGRPEISVSKRKQAHLLASIQHYMQNLPEESAHWRSAAWRVDVIAIECLEDQMPVITHFENALSDI